MKTAWKLAKDTLSQFLEHRALRLSAATAYYAIFSIGPLLVLMIGLAGIAFGQAHVRQDVVGQIKALLGERSAQMIDSMMKAQRQGGKLMATIIGGVALVLGATGVFTQLQDSLNTIWGVTTRPGQGLWAFIRDRLFSLAMVVSIGFLLLISMAVSVVANALAGYLGALVSLPPWIAPALNDLVSVAVITLLFALIFKVLPDVKIRWAHVWSGAILAALLFTVGKYFLGWYLGRQTKASAYGAGSAFVVILLYIYYSSLILYLGAEFTQVYARFRGARFQPSKYAVALTDRQRAEQGMPRPEQVEALSRGHQTAPASKPARAPRTRVSEPTSERLPARTPMPGESLRNQPWAFVGLAVTLGLAAGLLCRVKAARKLVRGYLFVRRFT